MSRSVPEWIAKHDDQKVPDRVRQRVFDAHDGICHLTGRKIATGEAWELEHIHSLILGGQHRESNLAPALKEPHKAKTAMEMGVKAKIARVRKKHLGIKAGPSRLSNNRFKKLMSGEVVDRRTGEIISR
ncbi:HNH endonuclease [Rhizobium sp. YAF28]|uniref:HNH endonuclease n=1 Tax=Rhizobium sp. YAF28 TaxID=3233081 RepID=UPI003F97E6FB